MEYLNTAASQSHLHSLVCLFASSCWNANCTRAGISVSLIALCLAPWGMLSGPGTMGHAQWAFAEEMKSLNCEFLHTHAHGCNEIQVESSLEQCWIIVDLHSLGWLKRTFGQTLYYTSKLHKGRDQVCLAKCCIPRLVQCQVPVGGLWSNIYYDSLTYRRSGANPYFLFRCVDSGHWQSLRLLTCITRPTMFLS